MAEKEVGRLRDKNGNVKPQYRGDEKPRQKERDRGAAAKKSDEPVDFIESSMPDFDTAELDRELELIQRSDYEAAITALNGSLPDAQKAAETTKLQMDAYDAVKTTEAKFDLYNLAIEAAYARAQEENIDAREKQIADFFADESKSEALEKAIEAGEKRNPVYREFQIATGLEVDGVRGPVTDETYALLKDGVTRQAVEQIVANNPAFGGDSLGLPAYAGMAGAAMLLPPRQDVYVADAAQQVAAQPIPRQPTAIELAMANDVLKDVDLLKPSNSAAPQDIVAATGFAASPAQPEPVNGLGKTVKQYVSAKSEDLSKMLAKAEQFLDEAKSPATAVAKAAPVPQPQAPAEVDDARAKIEAMFAQFNGEKGNVAYVYQRSEKLSPRDKAAATLVQEAYELLGVEKFSESERGHVAGGKTAAATREYNGKDRVVGENTWAKLEADVLADPEKARALSVKIEEIQKTLMADLVKEASEKGLANSSPKELPTPQNQANRDVGV